MTEFIGSRISLISKRDIRYVGILHEISSENSTVALEQVVSFGTEGRRPDDEVPPSDNVYEYIVFRGSDVKDLRIEEPPKENKPPKPPQVPDDPAILGSARRPTPSSTPSTTQAPQAQQAPPQQQSQHHQQTSRQQPQPQQQQQPHPPPQFQQPPYPYFYPPPPNQRFGPQGFPPGPGYPGMPYGAPPGWYPPPGHVFPPMPPGHFHPNQMPIAPPGQQPRQQAAQPPQNASTGQTLKNDIKPTSTPESPAKPSATVKLPSPSNTPAPPAVAESAPPPPTESKPDIAAALAPPAPVISQAGDAPTKSIPAGPKSGRIMPAVPLPSPNIKVPVAVNGQVKPSAGNLSQSTASQAPTQPAASRPTPIATKSIEEANRDARAAVAAAMAKLPPAPGQKKQTSGEVAMDNLTRKVNEMRTNDNIRTSRQPGTGGYAAGHRGGGRGGSRGGRAHSDQHNKKVDVPKTDYDFESANAKFNKQDLVKEAIASGSPTNTPVKTPATNGSTEDGVDGAKSESEPSVNIPAGVGYNKSSSFFDNISSESKDRDDEGVKRLGGREFRSEERQKNLETFGQGSVDNGYRGGYRGRGRARGYSRGRGGYGGRGGRGAIRGGRGIVSTEG